MIQKRGQYETVSRGDEATFSRCAGGPVAIAGAVTVKIAGIVMRKVQERYQNRSEAKKKTQTQTGPQTWVRKVRTHFTKLKILDAWQAKVCKSIVGDMCIFWLIYYSAAHFELRHAFRGSGAPKLHC